MNGVQHKAFGIATGCLLAVYAAEQGNAYLAMTTITAVPIGCMWPDIDHHNSKLGQKKNEIFTLIGNLVKGTLAAAAIIIIISEVLKGTNITIALFKSFIFVTPIALVTWIPTSSFMQRKFKFFRKHRGILHTLVPVIGLLFISTIIPGAILSPALISLGVGYATHLFTDWETVMGAPLLWPLTEKCFHIPVIAVRTKSPLCWLYVAVDTVLMYFVIPYIYTFLEVFVR